MFSKVEQRRKHYYRTHQRQLRVDVYSGMADALQQDLGVNTMIWQGIKAAVLFFHFLTQAVHGICNSFIRMLWQLYVILESPIYLLLLHVIRNHLKFVKHLQQMGNNHTSVQI
ncbi:hypothetical protein BDC45DRAFT_118935 [Circinella umbellata]|nr:hypothetical protein BDC45DRAFT_118935 [Circinella umbellata]